MKKNLILLVFILTAHCSWSQDVIIMRSGDEVNAKVTEVNDNSIKYKKADNPEGPSYSVPKTDVFMIKYVNGTKDVFSTEKQSESPANTSAQNKIPDKKSSSFIKYTNLTQLGFAFGVGAMPHTYGNNKTNIIRMSTINGIKIGSYFSTGIGIGLDYYFYHNQNSLSLPVYLDLRFNILGNQVTPVIFFNIGNSFKTNTNDGYYYNNYNGLMFEPGFEVKIPAGKIAVNFSFSYLMQQSSYSYTGSYYPYYSTASTNYPLKFISFKTGISF
ncbi:MAG: hypothetical protein ABI855_02080 [Bacteroidota bacterium]